MSDEQDMPAEPGSFWDHLANAVGALRRVGAQRDAESQSERDAKAHARARAKANAPVAKMSDPAAPTAFSGGTRDAKAKCCIASRKLKGDGT